MRNFIIAIGLLLGVIFLATNFTEIEQITATLQRGDWRFILLSVLLVLLWLVNMAASYKTIFHVIGIEETLGQLLILTATATFINVIAPSGGVGGMSVFIADARQKGKTGARALVAGALFVIFDYLGFFLLLSLGLIVLFRRNILGGTEIAASVLLLLMFTGMSLLLYLGFKSEQALADALAWLARAGNRLLKPLRRRKKFSEEGARSIAHDAVGGLNELRNRPLELIYPFFLAISNKLLLLLIFFLTFKAFQVPASIGTLIAGTSLSYLFLIVSPTPYGLGVVEGVLTLALRSMYIPVSDALVITIAYRGVIFWIPFLLGAVSIRWVGKPSEEELDRSPEASD
ncbi:MAG: flippase-like domain-containing protein [Anaerolineales bacterium]|nr:flippase-like domain-containing protein [Anaerolineales bacterium]